MITNKSEYKFYLTADLASLNVGDLNWHYKMSNPIINFQRTLRKIEYYQNCREDILGKLYLKILKLRFVRLSTHLGFTISPNVFDAGLSIAHYGSIVVSDSAKVGKNCRLHSAVNIGGAPVIGNNVYIGPGAKIFGDINIGDNVTIGANSVVNKNVPSDVTIAGVPARIIKKSPSIINVNGVDKATKS